MIFNNSNRTKNLQECDRSKIVNALIEEQRMKEFEAKLHETLQETFENFLHLQLHEAYSMLEDFFKIMEGLSMGKASECHFEVRQVPSSIKSLWRNKKL